MNCLTCGRSFEFPSDLARHLGIRNINDEGGRCARIRENQRKERRMERWWCSICEQRFTRALSGSRLFEHSSTETHVSKISTKV